MSNKNIVCFGPTNSGKSTFIGYLSAYKLNDKDYENTVRKFREEYGKDFIERRTLSYFVDTGKDEVQKQSSSFGTSKRKHIKEFQINGEQTYTIIDTPGTDSRWKNSFQGIFMGDIGIFIIEINTLIELFTNYIKGSYEYNRILNHLLTPVYLWEKYGRINQLIIAISKMDLCNYSEYLLARAIKLLKEKDILKNVPIVPISINIKERSDVNIFSESEHFQKYPSLISYIKDIKPEETEKKSERILASLDKCLKKNDLSRESTLRLKIIDGKIRKGDSVILGPVNVDGKNVILNGTIKNLTYEANKQPVKELSKNHIGCVIFSRLQAERKPVDLSEIKLKNTALLMDANTPYENGNSLVLNIKSDGNELFAKDIVLNTDIKLIWFGKIVFLRILSFVKKPNGYYKIFLMDTRENSPTFYFQKDSAGEIIYKDYVLQYGNQFVRAKIERTIHISDDSRKDAVVILRHNYQIHKEDSTLNYVENKDTTVLSINSISGSELVNLLFKSSIDKSDILEVAVKS